jgi:hypothetical protein
MGFLQRSQLFSHDLRRQKYELMPGIELTNVKTLDDVTEPF